MALDCGAEVALAFDELTPEELGIHIEAHQRREEREWYRAAWIVSHSLAPWSKKKLTPEKLLGRRPYWQRTRGVADAPEGED